jgi:hypothetical protein
MNLFDKADAVELCFDQNEFLKVIYQNIFEDTQKRHAII